MEISKLLYHSRYQHGHINHVRHKLALIGCGLLSIVWFITRIYYFPLKYFPTFENSPEYLLLWINCILLWTIFLMNIFWFTVCSLIKN